MGPSNASLYSIVCFFHRKRVFHHLELWKSLINYENHSFNFHSSFKNKAKICKSLWILASEIPASQRLLMRYLLYQSPKIPPWSVSAPSVPSVASTAQSMCTSVVLPACPAFLAAVANAVQQVLLAQQVASLPTCSFPASMADPRGVPVLPATSRHLAAQALSFAVSGAGYASSLLTRVAVRWAPCINVPAKQA